MFSFLPVTNSSVTIGLSFLLLNISAMMSSKTINISYVGCILQTFYKWHSCYLMMRMMMMINSFCGMVDQQKAFSLISSQDHCQRSSPLRISHMPRVGFEPVQNLSSAFPSRHSTLNRRWYYVDTWKTKFQRISTSFPRIFSM